MIAMNMTSTDNPYRCDAGTTIHPPPAHPMRHAMLRVLSMVGLGIGGISAMGDEDWGRSR
jgi:hypothetical protein